MPNYKNLDESSAFRKLTGSSPEPDREALIRADSGRYAVPAGAGLTYNYAAKMLPQSVLDTLAELGAEQEAVEKYRELLRGTFMNTGEKRRVLHHLTRGEPLGSVTEGERDFGAFYRSELRNIREYAGKVHGGEIRGSTGKAFTTVVQIGIGGSDLGPRALYYALRNSRSEDRPARMEGKFISNVDPDDACDILGQINVEETLFIVVSKSGKTQETLANRNLVCEYCLKNAGPGFNIDEHMIAVTSETSPMKTSGGYGAVFHIDDYVGGRYSSTSAVGGVLLSLCFGPDTFDALLKGAHSADMNALETDPRKNAALMDALIGVYERNVLGYPATAILPYSQALHRFPAHLQQLDMESNGKSVNRDGMRLRYATGPIVFGEPGTNGQHSFYQLLHQGTDIIPLQFIGFREKQGNFDTEFEDSTSQEKLTANLTAQIVAFATGKKDTQMNKSFDGGRPSSLIWGAKLDAENLGALLAHFENKVMFQGFLWNINSFDQEGVQLGKVLTESILKGKSSDPFIESFRKVTGI